MCIACSTDELLSDSVGHLTSDSVRHVNTEGTEMELPIFVLDTQNGFLISFNPLFIFSVTTNRFSYWETEMNRRGVTTKWKWIALHSWSLETNIIRENVQAQKCEVKISTSETML